VSAKLRFGNIFDAHVGYIVLPVNAVGVMGAGLAREAQLRWPHRMLREYKEWCAKFPLEGGDIAFFEQGAPPHLIWFVTKNHFKDRSQLEWIERGMQNLCETLDHGTHLALPLLGAGLGGLDRQKVYDLIHKTFDQAPFQAEIWVL
jgi:O-acetyl-ADP-ribose deacetylase (regulator of RNase III)